MKILIGLTIIGCAAFAFGSTTGSIDDLRKNFEPLMVMYQQTFDRAAQMKYIDVALGDEITAGECAALRTKVEKNYELSPFAAITADGSSWFGFCGHDEFNRQIEGKFYFQTVTLRSQFGQPIQYVAQSLGVGNYAPYLDVIYLDSNYRVVEEATVDYADPGPTMKTVFEYVVSSLDQQGNYYRNEYPVDPSKSWLKSHQTYASADGTIPLAHQILHGRPNQLGPEIVLTKSYQRTTASDWQKFILILTHAWDGGFYQYESKFYHYPRTEEYLSVNSVNGKEVCADGFASGAAGDVTYPAKAGQADSNVCGNTW